MARIIAQTGRVTIKSSEPMKSFQIQQQFTGSNGRPKTLSATAMNHATLARENKSKPRIWRPRNECVLIHIEVPCSAKSKSEAGGFTHS